MVTKMATLEIEDDRRDVVVIVFDERLIQQAPDFGRTFRLPAGRYLVQAHSPDGRLARQPVELAPGAHERIGVPALEQNQSRAKRDGEAIKYLADLDEPTFNLLPVPRDRLFRAHLVQAHSPDGRLARQPVELAPGTHERIGVPALEQNQSRAKRDGEAIKYLADLDEPTFNLLPVPRDRLGNLALRSLSRNWASGTWAASFRAHLGGDSVGVGAWEWNGTTWDARKVVQNEGCLRTAPLQRMGLIQLRRGRRSEFFAIGPRCWRGSFGVSEPAPPTLSAYGPKRPRLLVNPRAGQLADFVRVGDRPAVAALGHELLREKLVDPLLATAAVYAALATGQLGFAPDDWWENLADIEWLADGKVATGWRALRTGDSQRALSDFLTAASRGLPMLSEGVRLLLEGLLCYREDASACERADALRPYAEVVRRDSFITSFPGAGPEEPTERPTERPMPPSSCEHLVKIKASELKAGLRIEVAAWDRGPASWPAGRMPMKQSLTNPSVDSLGLVLKDPAASAASVEALVQNRLGQGWTVAAVNNLPGEFDLFSPNALEPGPAWDLADRLMESDEVLDAEPSFEVDDLGGDAYRVQHGELPARIEVFGAAGATFDESYYDWSVKLVEAECAWKLFGDGRVPGEGVRVGHPDSGYIDHTELGDRMLEGYDFVEGVESAKNLEGHHGLSTASVIISPDNRDTRRDSVTGIAPGAKILPLRVAKPSLFGLIPAPVLFRSGTRRLRDAILYALSLDREEAVHVISMSLGWFPNASLHRAIRAAYNNDLILIAAAGNYTGRIVVWPASYPETIALAACNSRREGWWGSARGPRVDVTGPGENIWVAKPPNDVVQSDGTSHATATTAGIAALWLSFHGRDKLLRQYRPEVRLTEVFRRILRDSSDPPPSHNGHWGKGIVNAKRCLSHQLPDAASFLLQPFGMANAGTVEMGLLQETFADVPPAELKARIGESLEVKASKVTELVQAHGRELRFWLLTDPAARIAILEGTRGDGLETFGRDTQEQRWSERLQKAVKGSR